jgi:competence protein ComEC
MGKSYTAPMQASVDTGWRLAGLMLAWIAGVTWQLQQPALWTLDLYIAPAASGVLGLCAALRWRRRGLMAGLLGTAVFGCGAAGWHASLIMADALPAALEGQDISVVGVIASLPQRSTPGVRFRFDVEEAVLVGSRSVPVRLPALLAVGWYAGFHEDAAFTPPRSELRAGQRWRFNLRLRQPHGNLNPHGFDYELSLFEQVNSLLQTLEHRELTGDLAATMSGPSPSPSMARCGR